MVGPANRDDVERSRRERTFHAVAFTSEQVADMLGIQANYLRDIWRDGKLAGRLPNIDRRRIDPTSADSLAAMVELVGDDLPEGEDPFDFDFDAAAPCTRMAGDLADRTCDPLLDALVREHGGDRLRRTDDDVFDDHRLTPSELCCLRLARERDQQTNREAI